MPLSFSAPTQTTATHPTNGERDTMSEIEEIKSTQALAVGDLIRFTPDSRKRAWWRVIDRNAEYVE